MKSKFLSTEKRKALLAGLFLTLVVGCGGGGGDDDPVAEPPPVGGPSPSPSPSPGPSPTPPPPPPAPTPPPPPPAPAPAPEPPPAPAPAPEPPPSPAPSPTPPPPPPPPPAPSPPAPAPAPGLPALSTPQPLVDGQQIGSTNWPAGNTADGGQGQVVNTFTCPIVNLQYHQHAHLSIFVDGEQLAVPNGIGFDDACSGPYGIHTHDRSGKLHLEPGAASVDEVTLGSLFAIWGMPLSYENIAGIEGKPVRVYVRDEGGALVEYSGDLAELPLTSRREVTIQIGTQLSTVPTYDWGTEN